MPNLSDGVFKPNEPCYKRIPIPDKVRAQDGTYFNPNRPFIPDPAEAPSDRRPVKILEEAGYESAEDWGNAILARRNGHGRELR